MDAAGSAFAAFFRVVSLSAVIAWVDQAFKLNLYKKAPLACAGGAFFGS
jgi:hypothetical protein